LKLLYPKVIKIYDLRRKEPVPSWVNDLGLISWPDDNTNSALLKGFIWNMSVGWSWDALLRSSDTTFLWVSNKCQVTLRSHYFQYFNCQRTVARLVGAEAVWNRWRHQLACLCIQYHCVMPLLR
jgi:hypothetical protein